jgi:hypothetical protein
MAFVVRIFVILVALMLAIMTAGITLAIGVIAPELSAFDSDPIERAAFFVIAFFATGLAGVFSMVPALALIALAEGFNIRTFLYYAAAGAALGYLAYFGSGFGIRFEETTDIAPVTRPVELIMASGIAGGLVYWLLAGRNAGRWHDIHTT